jgi:DNA (cytosine-5)-methyltransferase 1
MRFGSVCSGIEAASVAWHPLGWRAAFLSEIEAFPRAVLSHHYPEVPLHGDFTTIAAGEYEPIDLLVGGTPCQSFSVAGLRGGLDDDRGNLALEYLRLADRTRPRWLVWENVPGVLSSNGGRDFGAILGGMVELGYGFAYRVLDAQHFGVPQRRRRVFVVGYLGDWRPAAAVLFERHSLQGHSAPSRKAREAVAALTANGVGTCGAGDNQGQAGHLIAGTLSRCSFSGGAGGRPEGAAASHFVSHVNEVSRSLTACHTATGRLDPNEMEFIATAYRTAGDGAVYEEGACTAPLTTATDPNANILAFSSKDYGADASMNVAPTLRAMGHNESHANAGGQLAVAFDTYNETTSDTAQTLCSRGDTPGGNAHLIPAVLTSAVRRLTPRECERLQGFPDDYTLIPLRNANGKPNGKWAKDGPRYKSLGNSMAVPCMRFIGERIQAVEDLISIPQLQAAE